MQARRSAVPERACDVSAFGSRDFGPADGQVPCRAPHFPVDSLTAMSSHADVFACFDDNWLGVAEHGFEGTDGWVRLGVVPGGAGVERPFWDAVNLQQRGGGRARWKARVDFYADVLIDSPAYARLSPEKASDAEPFWLGLHPFAGTARLFVSSAQVRRTNPLHRFERHPGLRVPPNSTLLGFRLRKAEDGTYFEVARP